MEYVYKDDEYYEESDEVFRIEGSQLIIEPKSEFDVGAYNIEIDSHLLHYYKFTGDATF